MSGVLFICGSLEPGRDGVGDYTRRLAADLTAEGHSATIVATHDREITSSTHALQEDRDREVSTWRIPAKASDTERFQLLEKVIFEQNPTWLSLQYVPYSFSPYGTPHAFINKIWPLGQDRSWHVFFHELWVGHSGARKAKRWLVSKLQQRAVSLIGQRLAPRIVHTHLPTYRRDLESLNFTVLPLPLFTTIERATGASVPPKREDVFRACFFSQMNLPAPVLELLRDLSEQLATERGQQLEILLLGGGADKVKRTTASLEREVPAARVTPLGFLPAAELSAWMTSSDLAVSPVPQHALGKSTTIAAFQVHGLPIAAPLVMQDNAAFYDPARNATVLNAFTFDNFHLARKAARAMDVSQLASARIAAAFTRDLGLAHTPKAVYSLSKF